MECCYECGDTKHNAYECPVRVSQYKKLGLPITNRLKPLECIYCSRRKRLMIECKHIICVDCDYKNNMFGCCSFCLKGYDAGSEPQTKLYSTIVSVRA